MNDKTTHLPVRRNMSRRAAATRSLRLAESLTGEARREALREHFEEFVSTRSCPVRKS